MRDHRQHQLRTVLLLTLLFSAALLLFLALKWNRFGYTGLDLAIYTQALSETIRGRVMNITIHPHNYFGDHFEPILFFLTPFFALAPSAITLLVLQTIALASGAFPVFLLARRRFPSSTAPVWAAAAYLIHPFVLNPATYEFHALPFAIPLLLWTLLAFERERWRWFLAGIGLTLLVREDTGFVAIGLGLLGIVRRRSFRWTLFPIALGASWLIIALKLTGYFNQEGHYKFLQYYAWLGPTARDIMLNVLGHPWLVLKELISPGRILVLIGLLLPFGFLPLLAPRVLIGLVPVLLQLLLIGIGENSLRIHYTALLLPFLIVASLDGLWKISLSERGRLGFLRQERALSLTALGTILVAASVIIGPAGALVLDWRSKPGPSAADRAAEWAVLRTLDRPARILATFRPITPLAASPSVYSAHYVFMGHRQYTDLPYPVGSDVTLALFDDRDFLAFQQIYPEDEVEDFRKGYGRLRSFLDERGLKLETQVGHLLVYSKNGSGDRPLRVTPVEQPIGPTLSLTGLEAPTISSERLAGTTIRLLSFGLRFRAERPMTENRQLRITLRDDRGIIQREVFALDPLEPTSNWVPGQEYEARSRPVLARLPVDSVRTTVEVIDVDGDAGLDGFRSVSPRWSAVRVIGAPIELPPTPAAQS